MRKNTNQERKAGKTEALWGLREGVEEVLRDRLPHGLSH